MATNHPMSNSNGIRSFPRKRLGDLLFPRCHVSPATRRFRCVVALITLVAVAAIFIAPSIDLPDGVLRNHSVITHDNGTHSPASLAASIEVDSANVYPFTNAMLVTENRESSNQGYEQRSLVLRC